MWFAQAAARGASLARAGLGCLPLSGGYGPVDFRMGVRLVHCALDAGVGLLDLADFTREHHGERLLGAALHRRRDRAMVSGHVGWDPCAAEPAALVRDVHRLLRRTGLGYLDVCFLHPDQGSIPLEDRFAALAPLVESGVVLRLGLYEPSVPQLHRAHVVHPVAALAVEYSLAQRRAELELLPAARAIGALVAACCPLACGFLAGRLPWNDRLGLVEQRRCAPGPGAVRPADLRERLRCLEQIAAEVDLSTGRLALAWLLGRGPDVAVLPGSTDCVHVEMNLAAAHTALRPETVFLLDELFPACAATTDDDSAS
ncbi:MAG TPA: aldo/keto reductase [Actinocrinis sp.]|nr:aldo/keto reductase [Actinocrinis sp.]